MPILREGQPFPARIGFRQPSQDPNFGFQGGISMVSCKSPYRYLDMGMGQNPRWILLILLYCLHPFWGTRMT